jgi:hypothetical protein
MSAAHSAPEPTPPAGDVARRFALSIAGLLAVLGQVFARHPKPPVPALVLWNYLNRTRQRFEQLLARLAAGIRPRATRPQPARDRRPRTAPRVRLPRGKLWLRTTLGWQSGGYALQIEHLLNEPATATLVAGSPQAQRLLRPLCHMLGIATACVPPLPPRPRKPRPKPAPKPRRLTRKQREAILWYPNLEGRPMKLLPPRKLRA